MDKDFTVSFEIKVTKRDAVAKASMKKVVEFLRQEAVASCTAFIRDITGREFCFGFERDNYGCSLDAEFTSDETANGDDVCTRYNAGWTNGQHRVLDHEFACYEVERI